MNALFVGFSSRDLKILAPVVRFHLWAPLKPFNAEFVSKETLITHG